MPNIFIYQDYRKFLADYYKEKKTSHWAFSYQNFSRQAGVRSKSYMHTIINGLKNLSRASIVKLCEAMKLSKTEAAYFENLVYFNQAKNFTERNFYYEKLNTIHPVTIEASNARKLRKDQYEFYSNWYNVVIRSLIDLYPDEAKNYSRLAKMVHPPVRTKQVQKSVECLHNPCVYRFPAIVGTYKIRNNQTCHQAGGRYSFRRTHLKRVRCGRK